MVWPSRGALPATKCRGAERHRIPTGNNRSSSQRLEENGGGSGECRRSTGVAPTNTKRNEIGRVPSFRTNKKGDNPRFDVLHNDPMLPTVAEIVKIAEF